VTRVPDDARRQRFDALVLAAYVPLLRYLRRRTDPATADDVLGDTLLVLWRRFDDVPGGAELPWCFGVARGCLANRVRGDERQRRLVRRIAVEAAVVAEGSPDPRLDEALERLGDKDREILRLWAWEQLAPREIAVTLGISANAASIRLHRATRRLRQALVPRKVPAVAGQLPGQEGSEVR
jgi:RNA polymerase sigma-70 factor (ECF subfamily)